MGKMTLGTLADSLHELREENRLLKSEVIALKQRLLELEPAPAHLDTVHVNWGDADDPAVVRARMRILFPRLTTGNNFADIHHEDAAEVEIILKSQGFKVKRHHGDPHNLRIRRG